MYEIPVRALPDIYILHYHWELAYDCLITIVLMGKKSLKS